MKTDQEYVNAFNRSRLRVNNFARIYQDKKINLLMMPQPPAEDKNARDRGDMMIMARVEHKVISAPFTSRDDFPFSTVFVDETYKVDNKDDKVFMYVYENKDGTHAAVVYGWTKPLWTTNTVYDSVCDRIITVYQIDKKHVRFCKVEEVF